MDTKSEKSKESKRSNKSLTFVIEDVAKLLRTEVKKTEPIKASSPSPKFTNSVEQIAQLLRRQVHASRSGKKRAWSKMKKSDAS